MKQRKGKEAFNRRQITASQLEKFRKRIEINAELRGHSELADDFVGDFFETLARGWHQTVAQSCFDSVREIYGRKGSPKYAANIVAKKREIPLDAKVTTKDGSFRVSDFLRDPAGAPGDDNTARRLVLNSRSIKEIERETLLLFLEGWNLKEIGEKHSVSEARISQRMSSAISKLKVEIRDELQRIENGCFFNHVKKCRNWECKAPAARNQVYCSPLCAPGSKYLNQEIKPSVIVSELSVFSREQTQSPFVINNQAYQEYLDAPLEDDSE